MIDSGTPLVETERNGSAVWVRLNREGKLNALNREILHGLDRVLDQVTEAAAGDEPVRALVITGAGSRAFSAGADLKQVKSAGGTQFHADNMGGHRLFARLRTLPVPVIAAINGVALGGGLELALACDIRVAVAGARLGLPEVKVGVLPGWGGTWRLAEAVGAAKARELVLTGELIEADAAARLGLVSSVHDDEAALGARVAELTGLLEQTSVAAVGHAKALLNAREDPAGVHAAAETGYVAALLGTDHFGAATADF